MSVLAIAKTINYQRKNWIHVLSLGISIGINLLGS